MIAHVVVIVLGSAVLLNASAKKIIASVDLSRCSSCRNNASSIRLVHLIVSLGQ